ncbi:MAG: class I SAM-dependent methyltransferase [Pseudomonadota bacterium]
MVDREIHNANRARWEAAAPRWAANADNRGLWQRAPREPELVLCQTERDHFGDLQGKRVCVLGSGDNQVVFALAGLGAEVTAVDIAEAQLDIAAERAKTLGLTITFHRADVTDLSAIPGDSFDHVYTGGHVAVWVSDLGRHYAEAARILKPGGSLIVNEYHPFRRIWRGGDAGLVVEMPYTDRGPFRYLSDADVLRPSSGSLISYEYHWTIADMINAVLRSGCQIVEIEEYGSEVSDWEGAPMHGLPEFLLIISQKHKPTSPMPERA